MPSWFSVSLAQEGVGVGVGVAAVGEVQVMATTKCRATISFVVDGILLIPVKQHLELPVQLVFQGEQESFAAVCPAIPCWNNKIHLSAGLIEVYTQNTKRRKSINIPYTLRDTTEETCMHFFTFTVLYNSL